MVSLSTQDQASPQKWDTSSLECDAKRRYTAPPTEQEWYGSKADIQGLNIKEFE